MRLPERRVDLLQGPLCACGHAALWHSLIDEFGRRPCRHLACRCEHYAPPPSPCMSLHRARDAAQLRLPLGAWEGASLR